MIHDLWCSGQPVDFVHGVSISGMKTMMEKQMGIYKNQEMREMRSMTWKETVPGYGDRVTQIFSNIGRRLLIKECQYFVSSIQISFIFLFGRIDLMNIYSVHIRYGFAVYSAYIRYIFEYQAPNVDY